MDQFIRRLGIGCLYAWFGGVIIGCIGLALVASVVKLAEELIRFFS